MLKKTFIWFFWIMFGISLLLILVFFFGAKPVGKMEAEYDLWRGRYEIHGYGYPMFDPPELERLKPYGVKYRHVAGCVVNGFIMDSVATYNQTMISAIKERFGVDVDWPVIFYGEDIRDVNQP